MGPHVRKVVQKGHGESHRMIVHIEYGVPHRRVPQSSRGFIRQRRNGQGQTVSSLLIMSQSITYGIEKRIRKGHLVHQ